VLAKSVGVDVTLGVVIIEGVVTVVEGVVTVVEGVVAVTGVTTVVDVFVGARGARGAGG